MADSSGSDSPQRTNYSGTGKGVVMGKEKSMNGNIGLQGGHGNHMVGRQYAGPQTPGQTAQTNSSDGGKNAQGGHSNHMVGRQYANTQNPGCTAHDTGSEDTKFGLQTGSKNHMFGKTGSRPARPA